ncbi:flagellar cap protein FliD [Cohnella endophytica]|uniref:Flagellar hook-associated protein 2 n=1 Tax=Cohnella endophytica TaxID=2419778 RepID=A0A494XCA7_9BACL|nr:flagellar filament capping protein FliD [Cohnella endophytica]RKP47251.1 flagellar cap protein FliD [Cohnella endophytica]
MRISGFSSGMDIDAMVKEMMKAKRIPIDQLGQKKQVLEWQREEYRGINAKIAAFRNNKLFNYNTQSEFSQVKTEVAGEGNIVSAKGTTSAVAGTTTIKVKSLAESANNVGSDIRASDTSVPPAKIAIDTSKAIADEDTLKNKVIPASTYTFKINGAQVTVDPSKMSVNDVLSQINGKTNVQAFYDEGTGKVIMTSKDTGGSASITIEDTDNFLSSVLGVANNPLAKGKDASLSINGVDTTRSSNSFSLNGVEITLQGVSSSSTVITTSKNVDKIVDDIKSFINDYNELLKMLQDKVGETRYRKYAPLTDDQRSAMKESEITQWEAKAKSGLLANDTILTKTISDMRMSLMTKVNTGSSIKQMTNIGLETGPYYEGGKLYLKDENKLREALEKDPKAVMALFTSNPDPVSDPNNPGKKILPETENVGIFQRLYGNFKTALDAMSERAGTNAYSTSLTDTLKTESVLGKGIKGLTDKINDQTARLTIIENRYYRQFGDMEKAMSKFSSQSTSLFGSSS